jgi:hypothetical protein
MTKAIMPIVAGTVLGASVVSVLLRTDRADDPTNGPAALIADTIPSTETGDPASPIDSSLANTGLAASQLSVITDPTARCNAALALLNVRGYSAANIDEISTTLPPIEAVNFKIYAIVELGEHDARGALVPAMALPNLEQRQLASKRLARTLAERDPLGAIAELNTVDAPAFEAAFMVSLLDTWSIHDPDRLLAYLERPGEVRIPVAELAFELLGGRDPERLLNAADRLAPDVRTEAITAALGSFMERDPVAALLRVGELVPGSDRSTLEREVARAYGEQDLGAALRWANETNATADTRLLVLAGIQRVDPDRALELVTTELASADRRAQMRQRVGM